MNYEALRLRYKPDHIKCLLIAEAPPEPTNDLRFFYSEKATSHDWLFVYTIKSLYPHTTGLSGPTIKGLKARWLNRLKKDGFYLIDAVPTPIPQSSSSTERERIIAASGADLIQRIRLLIEPDTRIVLIKAAVYIALYTQLVN